MQTQVVNGIHLPAWDTHFAEQIEKGPLVDGMGTYQYQKIEAVLDVVWQRGPGGRGHAVDVGAHVGLWSRILAAHFSVVTAFEPVPEFCGCFRRNIDADNVFLEFRALGEMSGKARLSTHGGIASANISESGTISAEIKRLDEYGFTSLDLLKIDCEGAEAAVVRGGEATIRRYKPVVVVEQKRRANGTEAVDLLKSWGAEIAWVQKGDYCLHWTTV